MSTVMTSKEETRLLASAGLFKVPCGQGFVELKGNVDFEAKDLLIDVGEEWPTWFIYDAAKGKCIVNEPKMATRLKDLMHLHRCNGKFYNENGLLKDDVVHAQIAKSLSITTFTGVSTRAKVVFELLGSFCNEEPKRPEENRINVLGGVSLDIKDDGTIAVKNEPQFFALNRLNVKYNPAAEKPERFLRFMSDLLYPEDIPTVQEYLGYCLIPTTKAQAALFVRGEGQNGKSVLGAVLESLFEDNYTSIKLGDALNSRFGLACLENKLVALDDDLTEKAFEQTDKFKTLVTSNTKFTVERKGVQPYEIRTYARFLCFGNTFMSSLYDRSNGFYRRQLLIEAQPVPPDRKPDRDLQEKLIAEKEGIFLWILDGLSRLVRNGFEFTVSERSAAIKAEKIEEEENPVISMLNNSDWIEFRPERQTHTSQLERLVYAWCEENAVAAPAQRVIQRCIRSELAKHKEVTRSENVSIHEKRARGYIGVGGTFEALRRCGLLHQERG